MFLTMVTVTYCLSWGIETVCCHYEDIALPYEGIAKKKHLL